MIKVNLAVTAVFIAICVAAATAFASPKPATVSLRTTHVGKVLVGANGRTLYLFTADKAGRSACYGKCASVWPPLIAASPNAGAGLAASKVGTIKRADGKRQVTYGGHPVYFFAKDKKAGDVHGEGIIHFGGSWWAVSSAGNAITTKSS